MQSQIAIEKMTAAAESAAEKIRESGLSVSVEHSYMTALLQSTDNPKKAKFITVSVVISAEDTKKGDEYCLSVGAEIRGGKIDDGQLERDLTAFDEMVSETLSRLSEYDSNSAAITALANEAQAEYEKLVEKLRADQKKQRIISAIGLSLVIVGIVILFIAATLSA